MSFISAIPAVAWGSFFTLIGVIYADWRNTRRALQQNEFAAAESAKARLLTVRKEIYVVVPGALLDMQTKLFELAHLRDHELSESAVDELPMVLSKISMVGATETAILAQRLSTDYGVAYAKLVVIARQGAAAQARAEQLAETKARATEEYERVISEQKKEFESGEPKQARLKMLDISLAHAKSTVEKLRSAEIAANREAFSAVHSVLTEARTLALPLVELGAKLMFALRWELGQETDQEQYMREMQHGRDVFLKYSSEALSQLERELSATAKK